jgi:hypothetical protein
MGFNDLLASLNQINENAQKIIARRTPTYILNLEFNILRFFFSVLKFGEIKLIFQIFKVPDNKLAEDITLLLGQEANHVSIFIYSGYLIYTEYKLRSNFREIDY